MDWTAALSEDFVIASDGSEVRLLLEITRGDLSRRATRWRAALGLSSSPGPPPP